MQLKNSILINALGIQDSGGITVLEKVLNECTKQNNYYIVCNDNTNINQLLIRYNNIDHLKFILVEGRGFLSRLYYENSTFRTIIKDKNISLVYNFSGSVFNFFTSSGILFLIFKYGKSSPITPVDANNRSVILTGDIST